MSNGHEVNVDQAFDNLSHALTVNDGQRSLTMYAVICWNDDVSSHGGFIVATAAEAVAQAQEVNDLSPEGHKCRYIPVAIGMDEETLERWYAGLQGGRDA